MYHIFVRLIYMQYMKKYVRLNRNICIHTLCANAKESKSVNGAMSIDQFHFLRFIKTDILDFEYLLKRLPLRKLLLQMHNSVTGLALLCYCIEVYKNMKFRNVDIASANFITHVYIV